MGNIKDTLTTVASIALVVFTAIKTYLDSLGGQDIDWFMLISSIVVGVIGYFTGKNFDGSKKIEPVKH